MAKANKLLQKLLDATTLEHTAILSESQLLNEQDILSTEIPAINVALSGTLDGGMPPGLLQIAGESKHFKTSFLLLMVRAFQRKFKDGVCMFYCSEFGSPIEYFDAFEIDKDRVILTPITDIEQLKFDISKILDQIERGDPVMIAIDSIGNLASKKEVEDALEGKAVADMSRAKQLKSLFRIITPHLTLKSIYMVVINHVYQEIGMFPKTIVGGGKGSYLSSDNIWIIGREQAKDGKDLEGYYFNIKVEKSRMCREKSVLPVKVTFEGGIEKYSGLIDVALEAGIVQRTRQKPIGYSKVDPSTGELLKEVYGEDELNEKFWSDLLADPTFKEYVKTKFKIAYSNLIQSYQPSVEEE